MKLVLQMAPYVFVRPGELRHAEWAEFDLESSTWKIPAEKMKQVHIVPLSTQVTGILGESSGPARAKAATFTLLNEQGYNRGWIERQLARSEGGVRAAYNYADYLPNRRTMMQEWADYLVLTPTWATSRVATERC
ncbi:MAG: hypothetical protein LBO05_08540 [Deltaproteobacteria bacterium]|nr:hypothetical protein [Deltaproteobacteria bacterium]